MVNNPVGLAYSNASEFHFWSDQFSDASLNCFKVDRISYLPQLSVASLLFVDNPVGAGYSYVDSDDAFTTDVSMIAADMMVLLTSFFNNPAGKNFQVCTTLKTV